MPRMDLTVSELADAVDGNDFTEAEAVGKYLHLTVRPKGSSRTFTALVKVESVEEV